MLPTTSVATRPLSNVLSGPSRVNLSVLATVVWCILSVAGIFWGIYLCRANAYSYDINCSGEVCVLSSTLSGIQTWRLQREDITDVRMVRINKDREVVDTSSMRHRQLTRLGSTLQLTFKKRSGQLIDPDHAPLDEHEIEPPEPVVQGRAAKTETILFPPIDMGGNTRPAKSARRKVDDFVGRRSEKPVKFSNGKTVTVMGILCILGGIFSTMLSCLLGAWSDRKGRVITGRPTGFGARKRKD